MGDKQKLMKKYLDVGLWKKFGSPGWGDWAIRAGSMKVMNCNGMWGSREQEWCERKDSEEFALPK